MDQLAIPGKSTSSAGRANDVSRMPKSASDGPIEVFYSFFLSDLQAIESVQQKMTVTFYFSLFWKDDRVWERDDDVKDDNAWNAYTFKEDVNPADVWVPVMELANCGEGSLEEEMREINHIPGKGVFVTQHNVFKGTVDVSLDLKQFPFDYQSLNILIRVRDFGKSEIILKSNQQQSKSLEKYIDKKINLPDWYFMSAVAKDGFHVYENLKEIQGEEAATYAQVDIRFEMQRKAGYYMNKVWLQFNIISAMNLFVFVLDDDDISNKNTISLTLFLTIVALAFTIVGELPKISYRTRLDNFILQQFVFNLFIYIVNFILYKTDPEGNSGRIITLLILVGGFVLMNVWFIIAHRIFRGQHMRRTLHQEYHDKLEGGPFLNLNLNMTTNPEHRAMSMRNLN